MTTTTLSCSCGNVTLELTGHSIINAECCCSSCRIAGEKFETLPGAPHFRTSYGTTPYVLQRKDRVRFIGGLEHLAEHRLTPKSSTRRVIATCCNTPMFLEFKGGHWLSLYGSLWAKGVQPKMEIRTMTGDLPDPSVLPEGVPNAKGQTGMFFAKLLGAWIAMGFRTPKIEIARTLTI